MTVRQRRALVRANTKLQGVAQVPEIALHLADPTGEQFWTIAKGLKSHGYPPPYWAYAWAGGQAVARYILDNPAVVAGRRVLDLASGSGLIAIAAAKAGASLVVASDIDPVAQTAMRLNAEANGVVVKTILQDVRAAATSETPYDVILVGELFYGHRLARNAMAFLTRHAANGASILIGDPGATHLNKENLRKRQQYRFSGGRDLYEHRVRKTTVWELTAPESPPNSKRAAKRQSA